MPGAPRHPRWPRSRTSSTRRRMPGAVPFDPAARDGAAAARLPMGRRFGVRQSRRARPQGARRGDAARVLDRSAHVPGRVRPHAGRAARTSCWPTKHGASISRPRSRSITDDVPMGTNAADAEPPHRAADARQRREPAQPHSRRAREGFRLLPVEAGERLLAGRGHARRARQRVARRQGASAARLAPQWPPLRTSQRRRRHDVRLSDADRARRAGRASSWPAASSARERYPTRRTAARAGRRPRAASAIRASPSSAPSRRWSPATATTPFMRFGDRDADRDARRRRALGVRRHRPEGAPARPEVHRDRAPATGSPAPRGPASPSARASPRSVSSPARCPWRRIPAPSSRRS